MRKVNRANKPIDYAHSHAPVRGSPIFVYSVHVNTAVAHSSAVRHWLLWAKTVAYNRPLVASPLSRRNLLQQQMG